jgi:hypothetical protein
MSFYAKASKAVLLLTSFVILLITIFLSKYDKWAIDLFYSLTLFSLITIIDFLFYELFSPDCYGKDHLQFCLFPIYRIRVMFYEIKNFLNRKEVSVFILSIMFYISYFYFSNNKRVLPLVLILLTFIIQYLYLVISIFIIKNLLSNKIPNIQIRNFVSLFISISIILTFLSEKSDIARQIFFLNPFTCGFLSFLLGKEYGISSIITIFCTTVLLFIIVRKKFKEWPL